MAIPPLKSALKTAKKLKVTESPKRLRLKPPPLIAPSSSASLTVSACLERVDENASIDIFLDCNGRLPHDPWELVEFSRHNEHVPRLQITEATAIYRRRMAVDSKVDTPTLDSADATEELTEFFLLARAKESVASERMSAVSSLEMDSSSAFTLETLLRGPMGRRLSKRVGVSAYSTFVECDSDDDSDAGDEVKRDWTELDLMDELDSCSFTPSSSFRPNIFDSPMEEAFGAYPGFSAELTMSSCKQLQSDAICVVDEDIETSSPRKVAKFHISLIDFIERKCTDQSSSPSVYIGGLLPFMERLAESKPSVLLAIQYLAKSPRRTSERKALLDLVKLWAASYPKDFEDAEMKSLQLKVESQLTDMRSFELESASAAASAERTGRKPVTTDDSKYVESNGDWISIDRRKMWEKLPATYLCTNDRLIVKHKTQELKKREIAQRSGGGRMSASGSHRPKKFKRKSAQFLESVKCKVSKTKIIEHPTIRWRTEKPLWARSKPRRRAAADWSAFSRGVHVADDCDESESGDHFDEQWPHLTLYFEHVFPANLCSVELNPLHVAEAFTLLKQHIFARIKPREFADRGWTHGKPATMSPNVRAAIAMFEAEAIWTQMTLISEPNISARAFKLKRLIKIALQCVALGNIETACAIRAGIFKRHIAALPMEELASKYSAKLETLLKLDDSKHTGAKEVTRQRLNAGKPVLPMTAVFTNRLYRIEEVWKPLDEWGNINTRWVKGMYETICDVLKAQTRAFELTQRRDIQLLLIEELKAGWGLREDTILEWAKAEASRGPLPEARKRHSRRTTGTSLAEFTTARR